MPHPSAGPLRLEICVDTPDGFATAIEAGADRIELCSSLDVGGLTPSPGLMALAGGSPVPVYAMIRPRAGGFVFGGGEVAAMHADIMAARSAGLAGVVLGALRPDRSLDAETLAGFCAASAGLGRTLHRAVDLVPDMEAALESAVALGFERILTSGGAPDAVSGAETLARLVRRAAGRIAVMAGSGIRPENVANLVRRTGVREIHASARRAVAEEKDLAEWGFGAARSMATSAEAIAALRRAMVETESVDPASPRVSATWPRSS